MSGVRCSIVKKEHHRILAGGQPEPQRKLFLKKKESRKMKIFTRTLLLICSLCVLKTPAAFGYLGSFEPADGYTLSAIPGTPPSVFTDVTYYNAGQSGANAGGGLPAQIPFNTGGWRLRSEPGAFYQTSAIRNAWLGATPPYPASVGPFGTPVYIVGNHFGGRTGFSALALRNDTVAPIGPLEYDYYLDTYDFGGPIPNSGIVSTNFYFCPNPVDQFSTEKFIMSFVDTSGSIGMQLGYTRDNQVYWRPGSSGAWNYPGIQADSTNYDGFQVDINLNNNTFALNYFDVSTSLTSTLAAAGTPLGNPMSDLTRLRWWLDDQTILGVGGKNFFDDFSFRVVPEPSSGLLALIAACFIGRLRRGWAV